MPTYKNDFEKILMEFRKIFGNQLVKNFTVFILTFYPLIVFLLIFSVTLCRNDLNVKCEEMVIKSFGII